MSWTKEQTEIIQNIHKLEAEVANIQVQANSLKNKFCEMFCEFKKGDKVVYDYWGNGKELLGLVNYVKLVIGSNSIDGLFEINVSPVTKFWERHKGKDAVVLGRWRKASIKKFMEAE